MTLSFMFFINSILLGAGLAMDAFSVSLANGLNEPDMKRGKICTVAGVFSAFQFVMPVIGWFCVHTIVNKFEAAYKITPVVALFLLVFIGGKMIFSAIRQHGVDTPALSVAALILQGIATSIDALSVGFTISDYSSFQALICALIIGIVTFIICYAGVLIGKKFGTALSNKAQLIGGIILILIGLEIFLKGPLVA